MDSIKLAAHRTYHDTYLISPNLKNYEKRWNDYDQYARAKQDLHGEVQKSRWSHLAGTYLMHAGRQLGLCFIYHRIGLVRGSVYIGFVMCISKQMNLSNSKNKRCSHVCTESMTQCLAYVITSIRINTDVVVLCFLFSILTSSSSFKFSDSISMRPDGPRDPVAGPDSGPEPPYPIKLQGPVIKGFGRGSKEVCAPFIDSLYLTFLL
jgi:hypothetical protein